MTPTNLILDEMQDLLAGDVATLAAVTAMHVHLAMAPFTPGPTRVVGDFTPATFTGSTAKNAGTGTQQTFVDAISGARVIQLLEPAGGWHWLCTAITNLPQTIYGYYVTDTADTDLYGCVAFTTPIILTASGQAIDVANIRFTMVANPLV